MNSPLGLSTGAADIFANTGGVMEAALRTVFEIVTGREAPVKNLHFESIMGLNGIKQASLKIKDTVKEWSFLEGLELKVAVVHSLSNARKIIEAIRNGQVFHFVEVMACPGGCISGGGQPRYTDDNIRQKRIKAIYREDEGKKLRKSHENPEIKQIYEEFLGKPLGKKSHKLLHTHYTPRDS
jgi:iron only hydrogenase large subunit-like protein